MVVCELDNEVSGEILGWKLPAWQALILHRVLPSCGGLVVYLTLICFDFALICEHYQDNDKGLGTFCLLLTIIPALLSFVFTLTSPPSGLQIEDSSISIELQKDDVKWILMQFVNLIFFPIAAIGRYCHQIFWWIEAVCASYVQDKERTRDAILRGRTPSPTELYLFLQAFIHAAPHTIVNVLNIMHNFSNPNFDRITLQSVSIIVSAMRMASTATIYRRFEREKKICGRQYPWNSFTDVLDNVTNEYKEKMDKNLTDETDENDEEHIYEPIVKRTTSQETNNIENEINSDFIQFSPRSSGKAHMFYDDTTTDSDTSSDFVPPISPRSIRKLSTIDSDDEYVTPISIIDKVAPIRRNTQYTIENVNITPPPRMQAPRPGSLAIWAEYIVENAEAIPTWLSAPPRRKYCDEVVQDEPDIPRRVPRNYMRGIEPQDATAALVHYLGWYAFFISRLLSISAFFDFSIVAATVILFSHYQVILLLLIVPQASTAKRGFYIFLAFIYLFCLMEFKIRFRHVRVWHVFWIIVCTIEIVVFTSLWSTINNNLSDWWRDYVIKVIFCSMLLSYMCFLVYFVLLKPRETIVYISDKNNVST